MKMVSWHSVQMCLCFFFWEPTTLMLLLFFGVAIVYDCKFFEHKALLKPKILSLLISYIKENHTESSLLIKVLITLTDDKSIVEGVTNGIMIRLLMAPFLAPAKGLAWPSSIPRQLGVDNSTPWNFRGCRDKEHGQLQFCMNSCFTD